MTTHTPVKTQSSNALTKFLKDEEAATAVEYGLIAALIGAFIAAAVSKLGGSISSLFVFISGKLDGGRS